MHSSLWSMFNLHSLYLMQNLDSPLPFTQLLNYCSDTKSPYWQSAWSEFLNRYKDNIYRYITKRCSSWNAPRLKRQFSDTVNDAVTDVFIILTKNDCQALKDFRERDNEIKFLSWLAILCSRAAGRYMRKNFLPQILDGEIEEIKESLHSVDPDDRWELYETIVSTLRQASQKERDINILLTYTWADYNQEMISTLPCFQNMGHRVVDNVVNRLRNILKDAQNL